MNTCEHVGSVADLTVHQRQILGAVDPAAQAVHDEIAVGRGQARTHDLLDERFGEPSVALHVGDGDHGQAVGVGESPQLRTARHGAVVVDDLDEHSDRTVPG